MENKQSLSAGYLRFTHELLFSLNIALVLVLARTFVTPFSTLERLAHAINRRLHFPLHSNVGGYAALFTLGAALACCMVLLLHISRNTWLTKQVLHSLAGVASLTALPICWLYVSYVMQQPSVSSNLRLWLLSELAVAVVAVVLFLLSKWFLPAWINAVLLTLHFALWAWAFFGGTYFVRYPSRLIFPVVGLLSVLVWGLYVSRDGRQGIVSKGVIPVLS